MVSLLAAAVLAPTQLHLTKPGQLQLTAKARAMPKLKLAPTMLLATIKKSDPSYEWVKSIKLNVVLNARTSSARGAYLYSTGCDVNGYYDYILFGHQGKGTPPVVGAQFVPFDNAKAFSATFYVFTLVPTPLKWTTVEGQNQSSQISKPLMTKGGGYEAITVPVTKIDPKAEFLDVFLSCGPKETSNFYVDRIELAALN